jgi:phosphatidylserine/phosphatidylglycerophosphate/cardiolipin synthase-like enzyme
MLKQNHKKLQLESLKKTTQTKQQILKAIDSASIEDLRSIIPNSQSKTTKKMILENADAILNSKKVLDLSDIETESIILNYGRPVFLIKNNLPDLKGAEVDKFKTLITNAIKNSQLENKIASVGRIETDNLPGYDWLGTGWLFEDDLLITNRHVAYEFVDAIGKGLTFKQFLGEGVKPRIDFLAEHLNKNTSEFSIQQCIYMASKQEHDIAVFRIKTTNSSSHLPISILNGNPKEREDIAVIGYPAFDTRSSSIADMERIYQKIYDVKRFAPGKITQLFENEGIAFHDATTLGGNSGSVVLSLETGKAVALHFAGKEGQGNYSVMASTLRKVINKLPKRSQYFDTSLTSSDPSGNLNATDELVPRNCKLEEYTPIQVSEFKISGRFISYATPDSTYYVTKKMFEQATESILIGIYDFSADHMVVCIKDALDRGVEVSLMLDIDSEKEMDVFKKLKKYGVECVPAPSCASKNVSYFSSSHEKVIVIDGEWTLIQSGNYSNNSIPYNEGDGKVQGTFKTGNRDMGIAIESKPLAKFFTKVLRADMKLEKEVSGEEGILGQLPSGELLMEAPSKRPSILFPSQEFNFGKQIKILPILSPDNYMSEIPKLLKSAKHSIKIEQQYIRVGQTQIDKLIDAINDAKEKAEGDFTVQIIVAPPIGGNTEKTDKEVEALKKMGFEVCLLSKKHFVHCHNKLIIIDDKKVLISSQNWSDSAVSKNREAGVIIYEKEIAEYYSKIFDADWTMSEGDTEEMKPTSIIENLEALSSSKGKFVVVDACDIQEV